MDCVIRWSIAGFILFVMLVPRVPSAIGPEGIPPLTMIHCIDRQVSGREVFRVAIPQGWQFQGGITWNLQIPAMPANIAFQVNNPGGVERFTLLPNHIFFWSTDPWVQSTFPVGSSYLGTEVGPPQTAEGLLRQRLLPWHLRGVGRYRLVSIGSNDRLAMRLPRPPQPPGVQTSITTASAVVEYDILGRPMVECFNIVVERYDIPVSTAFGIVVNTSWILSYADAFRTARGRIGADGFYYSLILKTFRLDRDWYNQYLQLVQRLTDMKIREIRHIGELARMMRDANEEISDMIAESYAYRSRVQDKVHEDFIGYIRGGSFSDAVRSGDLRGWENYTEQDLLRLVKEDSTLYDHFDLYAPK